MEKDGLRETVLLAMYSDKSMLLNSLTRVKVLICI